MAWLIVVPTTVSRGSDVEQNPAIKIASQKARLNAVQANAELARSVRFTTHASPLVPLIVVQTATFIAMLARNVRGTDSGVLRRMLSIAAIIPVKQERSAAAKTAV